MCKVIGFVCVVAGCTGIGISCGRDIKERLTELKMIKRLIIMLRSEIQYRNTVLAEACYHVSKNMEGIYKSFLDEIYQRVEEKNGCGLEQIWSSAVKKHLSELTLLPKDLRSLEEIGGQLGFLDSSMQLSTLDLYLEQLEQEILAAGSTLHEKVKIYSCLGVMGGLFLAIILL